MWRYILAANDDIFVLQDVDSEIAVHLKRLARKDPTTKVD